MEDREFTWLKAFVLICGLYITFVFDWRLATTFIVVLIWLKLYNFQR